MFRLSSPHSHEDGLVLPAKNWEKLEGLGEGLAFIANSAAHILYLFFVISASKLILTVTYQLNQFFKLFYDIFYYMVARQQSRRRS